MRDRRLVLASGLIKEFDSFRAVDRVSFEIMRGECFGFLGPNGAGKTTLMRMIYCFFPPTRGVLEVFGMDVRKYSSQIKGRIGVMPQEDNLDIDLSVMENLTVYARYFGMKGKATLWKARELLNFVGLGDKERLNVQRLSGGMKRRLVLARSLINDPELIILDEPTTGLDPHSRKQVWDMIKEKQREGKTLILTTHYMEEAQYLCDRVAIMDSGRFVRIGSPRELMEEHGGSLEDVYLKLTGKRLISETGYALEERGNGSPIGNL